MARTPEPLPAPDSVADIVALERMHGWISGELGSHDDGKIREHLYALELRFKREHPALEVPSPLKLICWAIGRELQRREAQYDYSASVLSLQNEAISTAEAHGHLRIGLMALFDRLAERRASLLAVENPDNELITSLDVEERRLLETSRALERSFQRRRRTMSRSLASARSAALSTAFVDALNFTKLVAAKNRTAEPRVVGGSRDSYLTRLDAEQIRKYRMAPGLRTVTNVRGTRLPIHWRANADVYLVSRGRSSAALMRRLPGQVPTEDAGRLLEHAWCWIWDSTPEQRRYASLGSYLNWLTRVFGQQDIEGRSRAMAAGTAYLMSRSGPRRHR